VAHERQTRPVVVVSAADGKYFDLLSGLVLSFRERVKRSDVDLAVFDLGLEPAQIEWLGERGVELLRAEWDLDFACVRGAPEYRKAFTLTPFLPRYFPGRDVIVWIDADAWIQRAEALDLLVEAAATGALAAVPELDRCYGSGVSRGKVRVLPQAIPLLGGRARRISNWMRQGFARRYGRAVANLNLFKPVFNAGVFALAGDSPHWQSWADSYRCARIRRLSDLSDQFPLNHAIHCGRIPVHPLPAWCNWICDLATPLWDDGRGCYVEPLLPHEPIGIVHLLGASKTRTVEVRRTGGGRVETSLAYGAIARAISGAA